MGGHGKGWLRIAIDDWLKTGPIGQTIGGWLTKGIEFLEGDFLDIHGDIYESIPLIQGLAPELQPKTIMEESAKHQAGALSLAGFGASMGMGAASSLLAPVFRLLNYAIDMQVRSARVDPPVAFAMAMRDPTMLEGMKEQLTHLGWADDYIDAWFNIVQPRPSEGDLIAMELREIMTPGQVSDELRARGWDDVDISHLKRMAEIIPGVQDLIQMAVREAWRDDVAARFEYDADFPEPVVEWAEKLGLSREWVVRYWRAHWSIPGIREGFEMLHRLRPGTTDAPFTEADLTTLLRVADIPTFFRERLMEISYYPLTRVDVRRMYGLGVLDRDGIKASYLDLGYNEENAERMTEFTVRYEKQEQRDLTKGPILSAYQRKVMNRDLAYSSLLDIGYDADDAELFLLIEDIKLAEEVMGAELDRVQFLYVEGLIEEEGVYSELGRFDLSADQMAHLFMQWQVKRLRKMSFATKNELEDLYKRDIVDRDEFRAGLVKRRYNDQTIGWYIERLDQRVVESAAREAERAQKEEERILKAEQATTYQKIKAGMDVEIAALRLQIADIKLAMNYMVAPSDVEQAKTDIKQLKVFIAEANLGKAGIKYEQLGGTI